MAAPALPLEPGVDTQAALIALRRLRYYRDLVVQGFESTVWPDRGARTLRNERLALGIDLPELDTVGLWSVRCGDGRVAIPFIEFILARALEAAAGLAAGDTGGEAGRAIDRMQRTLAAVLPSGAPAAALPRLEEVYVAERELARLCGFGGVLDQVLEACETRCLMALDGDIARAV